MNAIVSVWGFFQNNILTQPAFFIAFIVLVGYMLLGRKLYEAYAGSMKALVGYLILNVASGGLVSNFRPILAGLKERFNLSAAVIDPYFGQTAAQSAVESIGRSFSMMMMVLLVGFMFNLILVLFRKITKVRTVFITGHIMVQQSATALWILLFCFPHLQDTNIIIMLGILLGTYWAVGSNLTVECTQDLTEGGGFGIAHQQMFGIWAVDKIAGKFQSKDETKNKKIEDLEMPGFLSIFSDNIVATSTLMTIFFGAIMLILGKDLMGQIDTSMDTSRSFIFYIIEKSVSFAVYLQILQLGVRIFVSELTESFQGISNKLLPGSIPAVDCAAVYGFGHPNAITLGFLFGALGQFVAILGLIVFKSPILIITGFVPVFFDNATFAVYANRKGGLRAATIITFISGFLQVTLGAVCVLAFGLSDFGGWHGNIDWSTIWLAIGLSMKHLSYVGFGICLAAMLAIPQMQYMKNKKYYFSITEDYDSYLAEMQANECVEEVA
ncbi:MAG: PTS ascorbate transporter subunit IIC [Epulopiscium sp. Nele67-Bin002]|nr:MAG: PTS ascorbate transporter subunit IIC [Epulopiscium sp. Nele67-Bin002]